MNSVMSFVYDIAESITDVFETIEKRVSKHKEFSYFVCEQE